MGGQYLWDMVQGPHLADNWKTVFMEAKTALNLTNFGVLRAVERVTLLRFLFGMHPYQPTLDFPFFILE